MSTQFTNRQWRLPNNENKDKQSNYSMDFDGTSGVYIIAGDNNSLSGPFTGYTISAWVKTPTSFNTNYNAVFTKKYSFYFGFHQDNSFINYGSSGTAFGTEYKSTYTFSLDTWYYLTATADGTNIKMYVNGVLNDTFADTNTAQISNTSNTPYIGGFDNSGDYDTYKGQIDALAIFDYALSSSQITTLYGSSSTGIGNPITLNPVAFYQLGDKSAFNGANYLVPNIAAQEDDGDIAVSYSPYALDFDSASSDYIDCGDTDYLNGVTQMSLSVWFNFDTAISTRGLIGDMGSVNYNSNNGHFHIVTKNASGNDYSFRIYFIDTDSLQHSINIDNRPFTAGQWHNLVMTYNAGTVNFYVDGSLAPSTIHAGAPIPTSFVTLTNNKPLEVGRWSTVEWDGKISNVSIWNTELTSAQITELYNEGVPSNLNNHSAYSNLVSWWQLGSNSSFNSSLNQWTCIDEKGTNTGESSQTFNEDAIVDGVGSYANGLSSGMGGDEVIGDAPYSSSNALSVNMDVEDRVTDTPS